MRLQKNLKPQKRRPLLHVLKNAQSPLTVPIMQEIVAPLLLAPTQETLILSSNVPIAKEEDILPSAQDLVGEDIPLVEKAAIPQDIAPMEADTLLLEAISVAKEKAILHDLDPTALILKDPDVKVILEDLVPLIRAVTLRAPPDVRVLPPLPLEAQEDILLIKEDPDEKAPIRPAVKDIPLLAEKAILLDFEEKALAPPLLSPFLAKKSPVSRERRTALATPQKLIVKKALLNPPLRNFGNSSPLKKG